MILVRFVAQVLRRSLKGGGQQLDQLLTIHTLPMPCRPPFS
jgi:hypothetical protein